MIWHKMNELPSIGKTVLVSFMDKDNNYRYEGAYVLACVEINENGENVWACFDDEFPIDETDRWTYIELPDDNITKEQALEAMKRIFNYCEEIDLHIPEEERTGYNMLPDVQLVERYILSKDD